MKCVFVILIFLACCYCTSSVEPQRCNHASIHLYQTHWVNYTNTLSNYNLKVLCPTETIKVWIYNDNELKARYFCRSVTTGKLEVETRVKESYIDYDLRDRVNISVAFMSSSLQANFDYRMTKHLRQNTLDIPWDIIFVSLTIISIGLFVLFLVIKPI